MQPLLSSQLRCGYLSCTCGTISTGYMAAALIWHATVAPWGGGGCGYIARLLHCIQLHALTYVGFGTSAILSSMSTPSCDYSVTGLVFGKVCSLGRGSSHINERQKSYEKADPGNNIDSQLKRQQNLVNWFARAWVHEKW